MFQFKEDQGKEFKKDPNVEYIEVECKDKEDYYNLLDQMVEFNKEALTVTGKSKEDFNIVIEGSEDADSLNQDDSIDTSDISSD